MSHPSAPLKLVAVMLSCLSGLPALAAGRSTIEVHAHRGDAKHFPGNTLPAFQSAIRSGADTLELDLQVTADNELVVHHDAFINSDQCLDSEGHSFKKHQYPIRRLTVAQVQTFDCGSRREPGFPEQTLPPMVRIPTLDQVFSLAEGMWRPGQAPVRFNIETKTNLFRPKYAIGAKLFIGLILETVRAHRMEERVTIESLDTRTLTELKKEAPGIRTSFLTAPGLARLETRLYPRADVISPDFRHLSQAGVESFHRRGYKVIPYTVNDPAVWAKLISWKIDGIITDDPASLVSFLGR